MSRATDATMTSMKSDVEVQATRNKSSDPMQNIPAIAAQLAAELTLAKSENRLLRMVLADIEMETRDGGQWSLSEINEVAAAALGLKEPR